MDPWFCLVNGLPQTEGLIKVHPNMCFLLVIDFFLGFDRISS